MHLKLHLFLTHQFKHVFCVFKRTASLRRFFGVPTTYVLVNKENDFPVCILFWRPVYLIEMPFNTLAKRADPDQADYGKMIRYDPTLVDLASYFFVLCTNLKVFLYTVIIHSGWSFAWIFMKEMVNKCMTKPTKYMYFKSKDQASR